MQIWTYAGYIFITKKCIHLSFPYFSIKNLFKNIPDFVGTNCYLGKYLPLPGDFFIFSHDLNISVIIECNVNEILQSADI